MIWMARQDAMIRRLAPAPQEYKSKHSWLRAEKRPILTNYEKFWKELKIAPSFANPAPAFGNDARGIA